MAGRSMEKHPPELTVGGCFCLEPTVGVEPTTCRLRIGCSTSELRWRKDPAAVSLLQGLAARNLWWPGADLHRRHHDFQSCALPTELPGRVRDETLMPDINMPELAGRTGFEPATFCVTGRYANRYTTAPCAEPR